MSQSLLTNASAWMDNRTGIEGSLGYIAVILIALIGHSWMNSVDRKRVREMRRNEEEEAEEEEPEPPRNFTAAQLAYFDGKKDEKTEEVKPVYLSVYGIVFDVTRGKDFYGPGGPYELFAGHECGVALAKMSFDAQHLDDLEGCKTLNFGEKNELDGWIEKFQYYRSYPIMGRLIPDNVLPSSDRVVSKEELAKNDGSGEVPEGYAAAPIFLGAQGKVYDVSFGGVTFYGTGCAYNRFAGKDASRALAKMSFDSSDAENPDVSDLTEKELKVLKDWVKTFEEKKLYPCVGRVEAS